MLIQNIFGFYFLYKKGVFKMVNITKIEALIREKGWKNSYFCSLLNKNAGWISDMRRGRGLPDENTLQTIADKLGTTVDYLTDKTEQKNKPTTDSSELLRRFKPQLDILKALPEDLQKEADAYLRYLANKSKND